jgi:hypothetical protein
MASPTSDIITNNFDKVDSTVTPKASEFHGRVITPIGDEIHKKGGVKDKKQNYAGLVTFVIFTLCAIPPFVLAGGASICPVIGFGALATGFSLDALFRRRVLDYARKYNRLPDLDSQQPLLQKQDEATRL